MSAPRPPASPRRVIVVGGGIAGLTAALHLSDRASEVPGGLEVTVLEAAARLGGLIRTTRDAGYVVEAGPQGFLDNVPATGRLVERLGLGERTIQASPDAAHRYLFVRGALRPLPRGPGGLVRSPILSAGAKLRLLREPFAPAPPEGDETVGAFARRRLGPEVAATLVDPMVSGVFAGDIDALSLAACFPKLAALEAEHGSLLKGMAASGGGLRGTLTTFDAGMETLVEALADALGPAVRLETPATALSPRDAGWRVDTPAGPLDADHLVLATPADATGRLLGELASVPAGVRAPIAAVAFGYAAADVPRPLDGFGFLVPRSEGLRTLGCLWESSVYPGHRAPDGGVQLRVMIGGAHDPGAVAMDEGALVDLVRAELARTLGIQAAPERVWVARWSGGIPQYGPGHLDRLAALRAGLPPGLSLVGSAWDGVAVNACVTGGEALASELIAAWS